MSASGPLAGRVVLLLRPDEQAFDLVARLESLGARTLHLPVLAFAPPDDDGPARAALAALTRYDLVAFTSATGVRAFLERTRARPTSVAAAGPATAAALRAAGIEPAVVACAGGVDSLCATLAQQQPRARAILAVRPQEGGAGSLAALRRDGVRVDEVAFYRTIAAPRAVFAARALVTERIDAVVLTSPSTLRFLLAAGAAAGLDCGAALRSVRRVAIGPVTAAALEEAGLRAHAVAAEPTPESVAQALVAALQSAPSV